MTSAHHHRRVSSTVGLGPLRKNGTNSLVILLLAALCWTLVSNRSQRSRIESLSLLASSVHEGQMEACGMCASSPAICQRYGAQALQLTRAFQGSGASLRRIIAKAQRGEKITVGVLGGSVSEGIDVPAGSKWHEVVASWFRRTFPAIRVEQVNGAVPGRGSVYFMSCFAEHIPQETDLVLIELGINDWKFTDAFANNMESLIRALSAFPNSPAIVLAETLSLTLPSLSCGFDAHLGVANFYDVPVISLRNWLLPELFSNLAAKDAFFFGNRDGTGQHNDYLHIHPRMHVAFGEMINALLDQQHCLLRQENKGFAHPAIPSPWPQRRYSTNQVARVPRLRLQDGWHDSRTIGVPHSSCLSLNSPRSESQLTFDERRSSGWSRWEDSMKWRNVKTYLRGDKPGDKIVFPNIEMVDGSWSLSYLRSNKKGLGRVFCHIDNNVKAGISVEGYWDRDLSIGEVTAMHTTAPPGKHDITCTVEDKTSDPGGGHTFLIIAIMFV